ncbi:MAG: cytochrome c biogenesis protein CcdA [Bacteroidia bacterium]|nr:cytochrome c biogenesis protein CcdA [Bacteroidia bacterium]
MKKIALVSYLLILLGVPSIAQLIEGVQFATPYIKPTGALAVGDVVTLYMEAVIDPGYHLYSARQVPDMSMVAATFDLEDSKGVELVGPLDDTGKRETAFDEIFGGDISLYHNKVTYVQRVRITAPQAELKGLLRYQVCDDTKCIPSVLEVALPVTASEKKNADPVPLVPPALIPETPTQYADSAPRPDSPASAPLVQAVPPPVVSEATSPQAPASRSLWSYILEGFLFGLLSVLTPCIFPMIPLTVTYFTKQSTTRAQGIANALLYGGSIVLIYTGLALVLTLIFGQTVLQEVANNPWYNVFFFLLLVIFGVSFLGMFEITLPHSWSTAVRNAGDRGGVIGIFLMALTLAIVSFSCTGPIVSTAYANAATGQFWMPVLTILAFSTALALPFMLFAIFPGWLQSLPKSGGWLNSVKVSLGFIELALALIYLSRADLVEHWGILDREIFLAAWIVLFTLLGLYLLGKIRLPHDDTVEKLSVPRLLLAAGVFWFVLYLIPGLWGAPLRMLGGYLPGYSRDMGVILQQGQASAETAPDDRLAPVCAYPDKISGYLSEHTPRGFCAFYDLEQGLAYARKVNKPVVLDYTGHSCANCRILEQNLWPDPLFAPYLQEHYILISLYTDDRTPLPAPQVSAKGKKIRTVGDKWLNHQVETYQSNAQPLYVLLDHDGSLLSPPMGFTPLDQVNAYVRFFQQGLDAFYAKHPRS